MADLFARSHQTESIITSPLMLSGPLGSGSGFSSVCSVSQSNLHDPLPLNQGGEKKAEKGGISGPGGDGGGGISTPLWIALQTTHPVSFFLTKILHVDY